jgi:excisionase family DNA binding protein
MIILQFDSTQFAKAVELAVENVLARTAKHHPKPKPQKETGGVSFAAEVAGYSKSHIYKLVSAGKIPYKKYGKYLVFNRAELLAWKEENRQKTAEEIDREANEKNGRRGK